MSKQSKYRVGRWLSVLTGALLLTALLAPVALADDGKQVGLVIRWSDGSEHTEIVSVDADATGLDALLASSVEVATYDAGFGMAVCSIGGEGCPANDCFCDAEHFWGYWNLVDGEWVASAVGAANHVPADGAVDGWTWTGFDAEFDPTVEPPLYTYEEIEDMQAPAEIPEPATLLLLGSGLAGLFAIARARRK